MKHHPPKKARTPHIDVEDVNTRRLPPQLRQLVRVLGRARAFGLVERLGGTILAVPTRVRPHHAQHLVVDLIGPEGFGLLVEAFGGTELQLPKYDSVARQARHDHVRNLLEQGLVVAEVALRSGYTMRHVHNIKAEHLEEGRMQGDLFDWFEPAEAAGTEPTGPTAHNPFPTASSETTPTP